MIGSKIKAARESRGWSQEYLADLLNVTQATISRIESGFIKPELEKVKLISFHTGVDLLYLLESETESRQRI